MAKDNVIYRAPFATPPGQNHWSKVVEKDKYMGKETTYKGALILDPDKNKEHKKFIEELLEMENSCREEAGHEPVDSPTCVKKGTRSDKKGGKPYPVLYIKASSDYQPETACKVNGWSPLKYDPWGDDIIQLVVQPRYNKDHQVLKLFIKQLAIVEEGASKKEKYGEKSSKGESSPDLLGIRQPETIEAGSGPDDGDEVSIIL